MEGQNKTAGRTLKKKSTTGPSLPKANAMGSFIHGEPLVSYLKSVQIRYMSLKYGIIEGVTNVKKGRHT